MLSNKLKEETRVQHQELEKALIPKIKSIREKKDYIHLLKLFYSYFGPLEKEINTSIGSRLPDLDQRRKADSIVNDLEYFGCAIPQIVHGKASPDIHNYFQAFGALYVIEGSTLGGKVISGMIAQQLNLEKKSGISFFTGYGEATKDMWIRFKNELNHLTINPGEEAEVIKTANKTFLGFKNWIELN